MSIITSRSGRNWTKDARRSAPARIANLDVAAGEEPRKRHTVRKQADRRRHWDLSANDVDRDEKPRRRARQPQTPQIGDGDDGDDEEELVSPISRRDTKGLSHTGTGDIALDDDDSDSSYNSFHIGLKKKALFEDEEPAGLISINTIDLSRAASLSTQKADERDRLVIVYRVYRSHYEGDLFHDGNMSAEMTTGTNRKMFDRELLKPLFRWVHVENPTMNFNTFVANVLDCPWLSGDEKDNVANVLKVARQNSDRSLRMPPGKQGNYVEPEYYEETIDQTVFRGFRSRRQKTETIKWMCIPYFVTGTKAPLGRTATNRDNPNLDLPPVPFLNTGYILDGKYFQCAQVWCMLVGDGLLVTCARHSIDDLPGKLVRARCLPPADPNRRNVGDRAPVIIVSDGGIRTWLIPVDKCKTWAEFSANFAELGVDFFEGWDLMYQDAKLTKKDWPKVIALAEKASIRLVLSRSEDDNSSDGWSEIESSEDEKAQLSVLSRPDSQLDPAVTRAFPKPPASRFAGAQEPLIRIDTDESTDIEDSDAWHVFTLLATNVSKTNSSATSNGGSTSAGPLQKTPTLVIDRSVLRSDCDETDNYLRYSNKRRGENTAWIQCPLSWPDEIRQYLSTLDTNPNPDHSFNLNHSKAQLFLAARAILTFFYPLDYKHLVAQKFWGAIGRIIESEDVTKNIPRFRQIIHSVRHLKAVIEDLKEELFSKRTPAYNQTNVPHEFIQAWLMILMFFVLYTTAESQRSSLYLKRARALLTQGKMKVIQRLQTVSLREREAVSPLGVATLLIGQLLQETQGQPLFPDRHRLASLYWRDIQALVRDRLLPFHLCLLRLIKM